MSNTWRQRRKSIFIIILVFLFLSYTAYKVYPYFNVAPTCSDNKQNGDELGVDCGGSCQLTCPTQVIPFNVRFAKAVKTETGLYDLVALVENKNSDKDTSDGNIDYTFNVYDKSGVIIKTVSGTTTVVLGQIFPVIVQNVQIDLGDSGNGLGEVGFQIRNNRSWKKANPIYANSFFQIYDTNFEQNKNNISQLNVTLQNLTTATFRNFPVRVMLYDENNNLIAVNETFVKEVKGKSPEDVIFTWRSPISTAAPKINVYPVITPYTVITK